MKFVKNKKIKSFLSVVTALSLILTLSFAASAVSVPTTITSDTIITKDNIYQVLNYLGIDSSKVTVSKEVAGKTDPTYTVQNFKDMIQKSKEPCKLKSADPNNYKTSDNSINNLAITPFAVSSKTLSQTDEYTNYNLVYSFTAFYTGKSFVSPYGRNPSIKLVSTNPLSTGISVALDSVSRDYLSPSSSLIIQYVTCVVGHYASISVNGITYTHETTSNTMTDTRSYYTSVFL